MTSYQLVISVRKNVRLRVGKLGVFAFPKGTYIYTGSAKRGMEKRIERHKKRDKPLRWHVDYLLRHRAVDITEVRRSPKPECLWNQETQGHVSVPGFGASDCKSGCGAHLRYQGTCGPEGKDASGAR